jgi:GMP synthase (glutamine-hydrolysing)
MAKILVLKHKKVRYDDLGLLRKAFIRNGFDLEERVPLKGDPLPENLDGYAGMVVMGGKMGVYDNLPEINAEMKLMDKVLTSANPKPVFGVCLGCQMLATVAGGTVHKGDKGFETGFVKVQAVTDDPTFGTELHDAHVYQWHQDTFTLAPAARHLMRGDVYAHQAIRFGMYAYGTQFHPEVDTNIMTAWHTEPESDGGIPEGTKPLAHDLQLAQQALPVIDRWMNRFVRDFYREEI